MSNPSSLSRDPGMPERLRSRERVLSILQRAGDGLVAYDALGGAQVETVIDGLDLDDSWREYFRTGEIRYVGAQMRADRAQFAHYLPDLPPEAEVSCWGVARIALQNAAGEHAGHKYWHPLARVDTVAGLEAYPWPEVVPDDGSLRAQVSALQAQGFAVVGNASQTILETAYLMRGIDRLFLDFYERPDYVDALFARLAERRMAEVRELARAGVDAIRIGDDIATQQALMISLPMYRERLRPWHAAVVAAAHEVAPELPVSYHSDGNLTALLPELIAMGVTAINPVQPECMDLAAVRRDFGADLTLWGCTPVQSIYAHGTEAEVRAHTRWLFEEIAPGHGLIVQFMNIVLTPRVLHNLRAFFTEFAACSS